MSDVGKASHDDGASHASNSAAETASPANKPTKAWAPWIETLCASSLYFRGSEIFMLFEGGGEASVPLASFPRLLATTKAVREDYRLVGGGVSVHWPALDEDIRVADLVAKARVRMFAGRFYRSKDGDIWCCFKVDPTRPEHCQASCIRVDDARVETFYADGRYDDAGQREHTLVMQEERVIGGLVDALDEQERIHANLLKLSLLVGEIRTSHTGLLDRVESFVEHLEKSRAIAYVIRVDGPLDEEAEYLAEDPGIGRTKEKRERAVFGSLADARRMFRLVSGMCSLENARIMKVTKKARDPVSR